MVCYETLCSDGGCNYSKKKKRRMLLSLFIEEKAKRQSVVQSSDRVCSRNNEHDGGVKVHGAGHAEGDKGSNCSFGCMLARLGLEQKTRLEELMSTVMNGYRKCNFRSLLDVYCPPRSHYSHQKKRKCEEKPHTIHKRTRRGRRGGAKANRRRSNVDNSSAQNINGFKDQRNNKALQ